MNNLKRFHSAKYLQLTSYLQKGFLPREERRQFATLALGLLSRPLKAKSLKAKIYLLSSHFV